MSETYQIPFLETVAQKVYKEHKGDFTKIIIVLPSRRAGMYFKQYFGQVIDQITIAPAILSMEGFAERLSNLVKADSVTLLFELFKLYKKKDKSITIEKFAPLGKSLLREFNMIDNNLTADQADKMFDHLREAKAIEHWASSLGDDETIEKVKEELLSKKESMQDFLEFWENLSSTYFDFKKELKKQGLAYGGLAFREAFDKLEERIEYLGVEKVIFAGFSQMSGVEQSIVQTLTDLGKAQSYFDADKRYFKLHHEAGHYLRRYVSGFAAQHVDFQKDWWSTHNKSVSLKAISNTVGEAKFAGEWLTGLLDTPQKREEFKTTLNHTAILLPDEALLPALLRSLPSITFEDGSTLAELTNITMGMSFSKTPLFDLLRVIFQLQERIRENDEAVLCAYFKDVQNILRHPYFQYTNSIKEFEEISTSILNEITEQQMVWIPLEKLREWGDQHPIYAAVFYFWANDYRNALKSLNDLVTTLADVLKANPDVLGISSSEGIENSFEGELLVQFYKILKRLEDTLPQFAQDNGQLSIYIFKQLLLELLRGATVPFTGVPIAPLQIMGMLESRALDFKNVLVLSCNEGKLPIKKTVEAIIPFDTRTQFGLPTYLDNDAAFAYTFYRLFHRADHLTFAYLDANSGSDAGEMSRLLLQVKEELSEDPSCKINLDSSVWLLSKADKTMSEPVSIQKTEIFAERIKNRLKRGVSPSAVNSFIRNPLTFIDEKVIGLKDEDEIEEDLDNRTFGNLIHLALEWGLRRMIGLPDKDEDTPFVLRKKDFDKALNDKTFIPKLIKDVAKEENVEMVRGQNLLLKAVAENLLQRYFRNQIEEIEASETGAITVVGLEKFVDHQFDVEIDGEKVRVRLSGMADRIDVVDGKLRVVDYKSGGYTSADLTCKNWMELLEDEHKGKLLQLIIYRYLLTSAGFDKGNANFQKKITRANFLLQKEGLPQIDLSKGVASGFYFFRKITDGLKSCKMDQPLGEFTDLEFLDKTEKFIEELVKKMLDTSILLEDVM
ncbi:hypothetical protein EI427_13290 [Flammeovirga pectinis]|uniref:PD-(D/E)XK endonuclease-like domain-containing protein n=1 Tax=Flammeovirga pectinis TaxID=2494373 RepID=A0A3S9P4N8_9BACT|nr:PD-(D/E)XK nuclease family protein [Flammeovirga pectinis]AZQ63177.1 hypothetical protein EI427_13290 [Flammeovirga pectinis]